jgi:hypothetical protein
MAEGFPMPRIDGELVECVPKYVVATPAECLGRASIEVQNVQIVVQAHDRVLRTVDDRPCPRFVRNCVALGAHQSCHVRVVSDSSKAGALVIDHRPARPADFAPVDEHELLGQVDQGLGLDSLHRSQVRARRVEMLRDVVGEHMHRPPWAAELHAELPHVAERSVDHENRAVGICRQDAVDRRLGQVLEDALVPRRLVTRVCGCRLEAHGRGLSWYSKAGEGASRTSRTNKPSPRGRDGSWSFFSEIDQGSGAQDIVDRFTESESAGLVRPLSRPMRLADPCAR